MMMMIFVNVYSQLSKNVNCKNWGQNRIDRKGKDHCLIQLLLKQYRYQYPYTEHHWHSDSDITGSGQLLAIKQINKMWCAQVMQNKMKSWCSWATLCLASFNCPDCWIGRQWLRLNLGWNQADPVWSRLNPDLSQLFQCATFGQIGGTALLLYRTTCCSILRAFLQNDSHSYWKLPVLWLRLEIVIFPDSHTIQ